MLAPVVMGSWLALEGLHVKHQRLSNLSANPS